jgi:hypothetical protein
MRVKILHRGVLAVCALLVVAVHAWSFPGYARQTKAACAACHVNPAGGSEFTEAGKAFKTDKTKAAAAKAAGADYVGINKCRMCHLKEYKSWQETKHANALAALKTAPDTTVAAMASKLHVELKGKPSESDDCVICHVTGFHLPGGYPAADSAKTAAVTNVTCEACHGPGSKHVSAPLAEKKKLINRNVTANLCTQCHTPVITPKFNFEEFKKRGVHVVKASG